jgi:hypothetical protein
LTENKFTVQGVQFSAAVDAVVLERGMTGDVATGFYESHLEDIDRWHSSYPYIIRASVLIMGCSRFESALTSICKDFDLLVPTRVTWTQETRDRGIHKAARYLQENFDVCPACHEAWPRIQSYFKIRDCFVHAGGDVEMMQQGTPKKPKGEREKVREAVMTLANRGVSENTQNRLELHRGFLDSLFHDMMCFWCSSKDAFRDNAIIGPVFWK